MLLVISVLGCNKFGPDTSSTSNSNSSNSSYTATAKIAKVVDLPATIGKSRDEIKKMINGTPKSEDPWLEYSLPEAELTFRFDKGKASHATFNFKAVSVGGSTVSGTDTAEQLGTMAGVDIKGKSPTSTGGLADTYEVEIGGKKAQASFYHPGGNFNMVMIQPN